MLNAKRKRFCEEYVKTLNATESALKAGYKEKSAGQEGHNLLQMPDIQKYLQKLQAGLAKKHAITIDELIKDLAEIKNINIAEIYDENGFIKELHQLPSEFTKCIQEIHETKFSYGKNDSEKAVTKIKFYSRLDAIEKLAKHLGFYEKDNEQSRPVGFKIEIVNADRGRAK